jgi:hypothetical protein
MFGPGIIYVLFMVLVLGSVVYLLICVDPNAKGVIGLVRRGVLEDLPRLFKYFPS